MKSILYLVHRFPFPPNKGDKIRSYNFLKCLVKKYNVYLGAFIDDPSDGKYIKNLNDLCVDTCFVTINPKWQKISSLKGFISKEALSIPYYRSEKLRDWVNQLFAGNKVDIAFAFSSPMAQYITSSMSPEIRKIMDFVDIDSVKWDQYASEKTWPISWIYKRESKLLLNYEENTAARFDKSIFVSNEEAELFKRLVPNCIDKIDFVSNGVDVNYFSPDESYVSPFTKNNKIIVFTGAMDYWANVDAVKWFVNNVFPSIRDKLGDVEFYIVGANPATEVQLLAKVDGVVITNKVPDIRPYINFSHVVIAPLRIARGIQNKILEALSLGKIVVASPAAAEGLDVIPGKHIYVAKNSDEFFTNIMKILTTTDIDNMGDTARKYICDNYAWSKKLEKLTNIIDAV